MKLQVTIPTIAEVEIELPLIVRNIITGECIQVNRNLKLSSIYHNSFSNFSNISFEQLEEVTNSHRIKSYLDTKNNWEKITSGEFADFLNKVLTDNL